MKKPDQMTTYLLRRGVPPATLEADLPDVLQEKLPKLRGILDAPDDMQVIIIYGTDSPHKNVVAVRILEYIAKKDKPVTYAMATEFADHKDEDFYIMALMNIENVTGYHTAEVVNFIRMKVNEGRFLVIGCHSPKALEEQFDKEFMDFLSHMAIKVDVSVTRKVMADI